MSNCRTCKGSGRVKNPAYPARARSLDRQLDNGSLPYPYYEREILRLFGSFGNLPEEEISCRNCHGSGQEPIKRGRDHTAVSRRGSYGD
jgi:DnaJ-class molecular chaperone